MATLKGKHFKFADFELDGAKRLLLRQGEPVALNSKTFDLLLALIERHGEILSKDELLEKVWGGQFVEEGNLTVQVSTLRKIFRENKNEHRFIVTVPGRGYSFVAELDEAAENEIVVESHHLARIVVEEEISEKSERSEEKAIKRKKLTAGYLPFSASPVFSFIFIGLALATIAGGSYIWQKQSAMPKAVPFTNIRIKRLTTSGRISNGAISPDGKLFVYSQGFEGTLKSLWLGHTAGGETFELRPPSEVSYRTLRFSPDSNHIYYVVTGREFPTGALFRLHVFGGVPEKLREDVRTRITFSPDMTHFAYVGNNADEDASTLFIAETHGLSKRELMRRPLRHHFWYSSPAWSPDGKTIAVAAVSEKGEATDYEIFAVAVADGQIRQLTNRKFRSVLSLDWQKDGSGLVMVGNEQPQLDDQLWHISYPDGAARQINPDLKDYSYALGVSDDNSLLASQADILANIWTAPAAELNAAKQITFGSVNIRDGVYGLEWMPNGKIVYAAFNDKSQSLWTIDAGGVKRRITPDGSTDFDPSVTADGQTVVFNSNRSGAFEVWRVNADGSDLRQLTFGSYNEMPSVSPDGKWVVYSSTRSGLATLWRIPLEGGEPVRLSDTAAAWARVSPDSRLIACSYQDGTKLAVFSIDGGAPLKIFDLPKTANLRYGLRWTPDGAYVTYRDWENGYWRQSLAGGAPQRIEGLPAEKLFSFGWSPDGKRFAYSRGAQIHDLVLIQNSR